MLERLGAEVDDAIEELRTVAHGIYPPVLGDRGVGAALKAVARSAAIPIRIGDGWRGRQLGGGRDDGLLLLPGVPAERGQARRARGRPPRSASARTAGSVSFTVEDDGAGFDPATAERGAGLTNLADRVAAVGGTLEIDARPGRGTRITGEIPAGG